MLLAALSLVLIVLILADSFETMVVPRRITRRYRITRFFYRLTWIPYRSIALALPWPKRRLAMLSLFGPASILVLIMTWVVGLILAFALLHWALETPLIRRESADFFTCFYMSGVTFFTLGYGDVTPIQPAGRFWAVVEAGIGFGFLAMVIAYLPVLSQAFSSREVSIGLLDARAGSPPTAGELLLRAARHRDDTGTVEFLHEWEVWSAQLLESHLAFPILSFYRSQHDNQSWLSALTAILDTCTIIIAAVEIPDPYRAQLTFAMARHVIVDLSLALGVPPQAPDSRRFSSATYERLKAALAASGAPLRNGQGVQAKLDELREMYEPFVSGLSKFLVFPLPVLWPETPTVDNWQTSAWRTRAPQFRALAHFDNRDEHF